MNNRPAPHELEVGLTLDETEVILNHPEIYQDEHGGHIIFSPDQAVSLGLLLIKKARECRSGLVPPSVSDTPYGRARWLLHSQFIRGDGLTDLQATILHAVIIELENCGAT